MLKLLRPELLNYRALRDKAEHQWQWLVTSLLVDGAGVLIDYAGTETHDTPTRVIGGVVAGLGLLATGYNAGRLQETSEQLAAVMQQEPAV